MPAVPITSQDALVLFSGGQDSATCLAWALDRFARVETLGFDYGQRHVVELQCRAAIRAGMAAMRAAAPCGSGRMRRASGAMPMASCTASDLSIAAGRTVGSWAAAASAAATPGSCRT